MTNKQPFYHDAQLFTDAKAVVKEIKSKIPRGLYYSISVCDDQILFTAYEPVELTTAEVYYEPGDPADLM